MAKYYHVIKKEGLWHLYAGNAISSLASDPTQANVIRAARALARHERAKVVIHKDHCPDDGLELHADNVVAPVFRDGLTARAEV